MTPERLQEILEGFKADRESVHQESCIPSDHCTCHKSADKECAEITAEVDRLTRELAEMTNHAERMGVLAAEWEKQFCGEAARNSRLQDCLTALDEAIGSINISRDSEIWLRRLIREALQSAKEKP